MLALGVNARLGCPRSLGAIAALAIAATAALSPNGALAQDDGELADVPTASDEAVLGASPLREEPAPAVERADEAALPQVAPAEGERAPWPEAPEPPVYATWWFWTAIAAVALGVTAAIVAGLTTDAPASSVRSGLALRF